MEAAFLQRFKYLSSQRVVYCNKVKFVGKSLFFPRINRCLGFLLKQGVSPFFVNSEDLLEVFLELNLQSGQLYVSVANSK